MTYIKGFDGIRALSILLVVLTHLDLSEWIPWNDFVANRVWPIISGEAGVRMFFVLSGFLITSLLIKEKQLNGKIAYSKFFARRFLRLLPPLVIFYGIILFVKLTGILAIDSASILYSVFYVYNFVPNEFYSFELAHTWSLAVEEQYYLTWPFIVGVFSRFNQFFISIVSFVILCGLGKYLLMHSEFAEAYHVDRWFIPAVAPIIIGSLFGALFRLRHEKTLNLFLDYNWPLFGGALLFLSSLILPSVLLSYNFIVQSIGIAMILTWIAVNQNVKFIKVLEFGPIKYIGLISYGIYVYQGFFLRTGEWGATLEVQLFPWNILITLGLAILSYELIEKPILKYKSKLR